MCVVAAVVKYDVDGSYPEVFCTVDSETGVVAGVVKYAVDGSYLEVSCMVVSETGVLETPLCEDGTVIDCEWRLVEIELGCVGLRLLTAVVDSLGLRDHVSLVLREAEA